VNKAELMDLKTRFPLPHLLQHLGLGAYATASCKSPLRADKNASWGIYESRGLYRWKDFGNEDGGDEIDFLARYLRLDAKRSFPLLVEVYATMAQNQQPTATLVSGSEPRTPPNREGFGPGTGEQLTQLSQLRGISVDALTWAQTRGVLVFGDWNSLPVFGVISHDCQRLHRTNC
jgi:hypothetical protein